MSRVLITGSNSGFGKLAALSLARLGHEVIATMRTPSKGAALLEEAEAEGLTIEIRTLDVTDPASVDAASRWAVAGCSVASSVSCAT